MVFVCAVLSDFHPPSEQIIIYYSISCPRLPNVYCTIYMTSFGRHTSILLRTFKSSDSRSVTSTSKYGPFNLISQWFQTPYIKLSFWVQALEFSNTISLCTKNRNKEVWINVICLPEMRKDREYKPVLTLDTESTEICSVQCGCPAGRGPGASCKHVAALCYAIANFCAFGRLPGFLTYTERLQDWKKSRSKTETSSDIISGNICSQIFISRPFFFTLIAFQGAAWDTKVVNT